MAGRLEVCQDKAGEFRFRLKAGNGETVLTNAGDPGMFESKETASGNFRFNLKPKNH